MKRPILSAALLAVVLATPGCAQRGGILGRVAAAAGGAIANSFPIGVQKEVEIGRGVAATVIGRWGLVQDDSLSRYVNMVGQVVAQQSPRASELTYRFAVLNTDEVNAFAAPGGYVFVTRGALDVMQSESELAAVLGHEIAHVDLKHVLRRVQRASMLEGARDEANLTGPVLDAIFSAGASTLFTGLERGDELASDSLGMLYANAAGYRGDGMARFPLPGADAGRRAAAAPRLHGRPQQHPSAGQPAPRAGERRRGGDGGRHDFRPHAGDALPALRAAAGESTAAIAGRILPIRWNAPGPIGPGAFFDFGWPGRSLRAMGSARELLRQDVQDEQDGSFAERIGCSSEVASPRILSIWFILSQGL
jgi:beta-barrel assembly-enhancing protease